MRFGRRYRARRLHQAVLAQDRSRVEMLLAAGAEVNGRDRAGRTPLFLAVSRADTEIIRMLVTADADPDARSDFGYTPCYGALTSLTGSAETVALLRDHGADARLMIDIHATDEFDRIPLHYAAFYGHLPLQDELIGILLALGSDIHARDHAGHTPLHAAAGSANPQAALALLEAGAEVDATDHRGGTPLLIAVNSSRTADRMIALLRQWGANPFHKNKRESSSLRRAHENVSGETPIWFVPHCRTCSPPTTPRSDGCRHRCTTHRRPETPKPYTCSWRPALIRTHRILEVAHPFIWLY